MNNLIERLEAGEIVSFSPPTSDTHANFAVRKVGNDYSYAFYTKGLFRIERHHLVKEIYPYQRKVQRVELCSEQIRVAIDTYCEAVDEYGGFPDVEVYWDELFKSLGFKEPYL